jgi:hypothetical protein
VALYGVERPFVVKPSVSPTCEWYLVPSRYEFTGAILLSRILTIRDIAAAKSRLTHRFAARCYFIEFRCTFALFCFTCCKRAPFGFDPDSYPSMYGLVAAGPEAAVKAVLNTFSEL